jgi:hypothetical protein
LFAEQVQVRAAATGERWWRRLYPASFVLAGITALVVWSPWPNHADAITARPPWDRADGN